MSRHTNVVSSHSAIWVLSPAKCMLFLSALHSLHITLNLIPADKRERHFSTVHHLYVSCDVISPFRHSPELTTGLAVRWAMSGNQGNVSGIRLYGAGSTSGVGLHFVKT